jgi:phospholipase/carboxylesterase
VPPAHLTPNHAAEEPEDDGTALWLGPRQADRRLVLLHGWGADADDLLDLGEALLGGAAGSSNGLSVVALRAPLLHPAGSGRQWYDLQQPEWPQLPAARKDLRLRLLQLDRSVPLGNTAILGFSQGAAMAIDVAMGGGADEAEPLALAALIACSGYPHPDWLPQRPRTKILLTHGEQDPVVPVAASAELERSLRKAGGSVQRITFQGGHGIDPQLFPVLREFLETGWSAG